jgi:hypothetical protein
VRPFAFNRFVTRPAAVICFCHSLFSRKSDKHKGDPFRTAVEVLESGCYDTAHFSVERRKTHFHSRKCGVSAMRQMCYVDAHLAM